jgi:hypothetical protein
MSDKAIVIDKRIAKHEAAYIHSRIAEDRGKQREKEKRAV